MVPYWFHEEFRTQSAQGIVIGAEDTGELVDELLRLSAGDGPMADEHKRPGPKSTSTDLHWRSVLRRRLARDPVA